MLNFLYWYWFVNGYFNVYWYFNRVGNLLFHWVGLWNMYFYRVGYFFLDWHVNSLLYRVRYWHFLHHCHRLFVVDVS